MKTYDELLIELVRREMNGMRVYYGEYSNGFEGGLPDLFYESSFDAVRLLQKRGNRSSVEKREDDEVSPEQFEFNILCMYGLADERKNIVYYKTIKRKIQKSEELFNLFLKRFRDCSTEEERIAVVKSIVGYIEGCIRRCSMCPSDYFFLRRFGLYG